MDTVTVKTPISLTIAHPLFEQLQEHLFPGDWDEHAAVIAAGLVTTSRGTRLLARDVFLARDGIDFVPGTRGYRALTAQFVAEMSDHCGQENLCYLTVHCHGGTDEVGLSGDDLASHERGYPAILDITKGGPVGGLVFATQAVAGDIWTVQGRFPLDHLTVIGSRIRTLYASRQPRPLHCDPVYDRHARLFGDVGQGILTNLKVGIIGLGGGGSLLNEWLSRLGVGHIVGVDFDRVDVTNLPRVVGASSWDAHAWLTRRRTNWIQKIGRRYANYKVVVARRVAKRANPAIQYDVVIGNVLDEEVALLLRDVDFLFLASDTIQSRLVFNALTQQYLIPGAQVGAKVLTEKETGRVGDITVATRLVLPFPRGGCLECHGLIPASFLNMESMNIEGRKKQRYVDDDTVVEPSVITLNALSAAQAANDLMMMFAGLYHERVTLPHQIHFARERRLFTVEGAANDACPDCGSNSRSRRARGDRYRLPCRMVRY